MKYLKQKLNKREILILIATVLVACVFYFKFYVIPSQTKISEAYEKLHHLEQEYLQLQAKAPLSFPSEKKWLGTHEAVNKSVDALAKPIHLNGMTLLRVEFNEADSKEASFQTKKVTLTLSGNFTRIRQYLEHLEKLPTPLVIESFSMAIDSNKPSSVLAKITGGFYASP